MMLMAVINKLYLSIYLCVIHHSLPTYSKHQGNARKTRSLLGFKSLHGVVISTPGYGSAGPGWNLALAVSAQPTQTSALPFRADR